ncbi:hypothetical protein P43SY_007333 [Pythium insidiosum]|uniref:RanBP2-type domain-containing protein n=1 Tax=Pythium insidiosum TaxID=114742 RepID=A0AAD5M5Y6_PYTIN|nr:hypothetical protein P43SY_007333 [Pythium insidiosum]
MELEIQTLVQSVDEQLSAIDPFARTNREANGASPDDVRAVQEVPSFLSHHPVYQESLIAKRLQLYERQLAIREQQLAKLQQMNEQANSTIRRLHEDLATQRKAFEDAQTDWEEEKTALLRFRVGAAQDQSQKATLMRNLLGNRPLPMTGRTRDDDAEQRRHQQWRLQMLSGAADAQAQLDDAAPLQLAALSRGGRTWRRLKLLFQRRLAPFATDIRQIEARFGYSVASYFRFFRWIILAFVAVAIPALGLLVMHIIVIVRSRDAQPSSDTTWRQFVGVAPRFLLLSGHYEAEALAYTSVLVAMEILLLVLTFHKWILEDRASKTVEAMDNGEKKPKFAKLILNAWDSSLSTKEASPSVALLALVLHVINFKFDKAILMRLQKKPTSPWSAKDAGEFFIKFFFCTVAIFITFVHFFLGNRPCYAMLLSNSTIAWGVAGAVVVMLLLLRNSLKVQQALEMMRQHEITLTLATLQRKVKQLETRLRLPATMADDSEQWSCPTCTLMNGLTVEVCEACGTTSPLVLESYQIEEQASAAAAMMAEAAASPSGGQRGPTRGAAAGRSNSQESAMSDAMMDDEASDSDLWTQAEIEWAHVEAHQESNAMRKRK